MRNLAADLRSATWAGHNGTAPTLADRCIPLVHRRLWQAHTVRHPVSWLVCRSAAFSPCEAGGESSPTIFRISTVSPFLATHLPGLARLLQAGRRAHDRLAERTPGWLRFARWTFWLLAGLLGYASVGALVLGFDQPASGKPGPLAEAFLLLTMFLAWLGPIVLTVYAAVWFASTGKGLASTAFRLLLVCAAVLGVIFLCAELKPVSEMTLVYLGGFVAMVLGPLAVFGGLIAALLWPIGLWQAWRRQQAQAATADQAEAAARSSAMKADSPLVNTARKSSARVSAT